MTQLRRLRTDSDLKGVIEGSNRVIDALLGNTGGRIHLLDDDGLLLDTVGGASLGTSEPALKVRSAIGEHALFQHSDGVTTIMEVQDSGVTINGLDLTGNLDVAGDLTVEGNTVLGNANTDTTLITGPLTIQDWVIDLATDDLIFKDDAGAEIVRIGDTASTWHFKVTGPMQATGDIESGGNVKVNSSGYLQIGATANIASAGHIRGTSTFTLKARNGGGSNDLAIITVDGSDNVVFGATTSVGDVSIAGNSTRLYAGSTERLRVDSTGIGFLGATPVARPTVVGVLSGSPTLAQLTTVVASILAALDETELGLVTDSTT